MFTAAAVLAYTEFLMEGTIPTYSVKFFPYQKPWVDRSIRKALNVRTAAYNAGLHDKYKVASYNLQLLFQYLKPIVSLNVAFPSI